MIDHHKTLHRMKSLSFRSEIGCFEVCMFLCSSGTGCSGFYVMIFVERVVEIEFTFIVLNCAKLKILFVMV